MLGVFGGTFDPIHFGHLRTGLEVVEALALEELRFIPCGLPPHRAAPLASAEQRLQMLRLAVAGEPRFAIDQQELERAGPSYSVDTLEALRAELGERRPVCLLMGLDALQGITGWHQWQRLIELAHLAVVHRPGWPAEVPADAAAVLTPELCTEPARLRERPAGGVCFLPVTQLDISASRIRSLLAAGRSVRYLVPDAVEGYLREAGPYQRPAPGAGR